MSKNKNNSPRGKFNDAKKNASTAFNAFKAWETAAFLAAVSAKKGCTTPEFKRALCVALNGTGYKAELPKELKEVVDGRAFFEEKWQPMPGKGKAPTAKDREMLGREKNKAGKGNHVASDEFTRVADLATKEVDEGKGEEPAETKEERKLREARELLAKNGYTIAQTAEAEKPAETKAA